ncbi:hypothetical protein D0T87_13625 [Bacteroides sp. 51]|nr:hypothetical protein [Bacteroides sp. 51]
MCLTLLAIAICGGFTACSDDDDYVAAPMPEGAQVYFSNTLSSTLILSIQNTSFDVELRRVKKEEALSVPLKIEVEDPENIFSIPETASFPAGSDVTKITVTYDPEKIEYDDYKDISITINDENNTSAYGKAIYAFKAGIPAPWQSLGLASFTDNWAGQSSKIELQQHMVDPTRYRLMGPYEEYADEFLEFSVLPAGSVYKDVTTTIEGLVVYNDFAVFYHPTYEDIVYGLHPSRMTSLATEASWTYNVVTQFSADGKPEILQIAPYYYIFGLGGWNQTQASNIITIIFPSVVLSDYSLEVMYAGRYVDANENEFAMAEVTLGEDLTSAKIAIIAGIDAEEAADAIINGSLESVEITASGNVSLPCSVSGNYTFVVVGYDGNEAKKEATTIFKFTSASDNSPVWNSLGMATYTDDIVGPLYGGGNNTYQVEIQENAAVPGLFRLVNPYGEAFPYNEPGDWDDSKDYYLEINATDHAGVYIDLQNTGLDWGDGNFYVYSLAAYRMDNNGKTLEEVKADGICGTYDGNEITFPTKSILAMFPNDGPHTANPNGKFKIVMPAAAPAPVASLAHTKSTGSVFTKSFDASPVNFKLLRTITSFDQVIK